jgi:hypothetical protein
MHIDWGLRGADFGIGHIQQHSGSAAAPAVRAIKICLAAPQVSDHVRRIKKMLLDLQMLSAVVF